LSAPNLARRNKAENTIEADNIAQVIARPCCVVAPAGWQFIEEDKQDVNGMIEMQSYSVASIFLREGGELALGIDPWRSWGAEVRNMLGEGV
jgi:hypothetical protein